MKMNRFSLISLIIGYGSLWVVLNSVEGYKPVVIIHGMFDKWNSLYPLRDRIIEQHPGTNVTVIDKLHRFRSMFPMWTQFRIFEKELKPILTEHPDGIHLIGYSQGGLLARALLQSISDHNVHNFISLSSPQGGQYGDEFLRLYLPTYVKENAWKVFYRESGQRISIGNYWRDPHHLQEYMNTSVFLPLIDNEIWTEDSTKYKENFGKLKKLVLIGGPDDGVISPWQSSQFACFNEKEDLVFMKDRTYYKNDSFGLKTLDKQGRIVRITVPGVKHHDWHKMDRIMDNYVIPHLD